MFGNSNLFTPPPPPPLIRWAGHFFSNPAMFSASIPLSAAGLYAIMAYDPNWAPMPYRPVYFGQTDDFSQRVNTNHERYDSWTRNVGGASKLYLAFHYMTGSTEYERCLRESALIRHYDPPCNRSLSVGSGLAALLSTPTPRRQSNANLSTLAELFPPARYGR